MGTGNLTDDLKRDAVAQIMERGYSVIEASERLGVSTHSNRAWKRKFARQYPEIARRMPRSGS